MAGFRTHIGFAASIGAAYGLASVNTFGFDGQSALLAAGLTAVGGMLPDLDSDTGRPVREVCGLAAAVVPLLLFRRFVEAGLSHEGVVTALVTCYLGVRYGGAWVMSQITVHRGMFHSIPAMLIAGLAVYLGYSSPHRPVRVLLAGGVMLGFLSHLVLDEIYSVDFNGVRLKVKSSAGSALKFFSPSVLATTACYTILGALGYLAVLDFESQQPLRVREVVMVSGSP